MTPQTSEHTIGIRYTSNNNQITTKVCNGFYYRMHTSVWLLTIRLPKESISHKVTLRLLMEP